MQNKFNFTKKAIESLPLPAEGKRGYYYDNVVRGLGLSVTSKGNKTFILYRKIRGKPERITLGRHPDLSIEKARGKAEALNSRIVDGENPSDDKRKIRNEQTFAELFNRYIEDHAKLHKKSWQGDVLLYNYYLKDWQGCKLSSLQKATIEKKHTMVGQNHGPYAANRGLSLIHTVFNKAIDWGWEGTNPAVGIKKFKEKSRDRFLQPHEMAYFFQSLEKEENKTAADYVMISLLTGARKMNVLSMRWEQINMELAQWRIPETKNGDSLILPLSTQAMEILKKRRESTHEWVFPSETSKHGFLQDPKKAWKRILQRAECYQYIALLAPAEKWEEKKIASEKKTMEDSLSKKLSTYQEHAKTLKLDTSMIAMQDLRIHDLRRSLGSWQAVTGANSYVIGKSLGHKSQQATAIYARLNLDPVRESVERATAAMLQAGGKR